MGEGFVEENGRCFLCVTKSINNRIRSVESFVYLGNKLNTGEECSSAVTVRICVGWRKFKEMSSYCVSKGIDKWLEKTNVITAKKYMILMRSRKENVVLQ